MIIRTDRSRVEQAQRCLRSRWLNYHEGPDGMGLTSAAKPLPLAVGGAVHAGLAALLDLGESAWKDVTSREEAASAPWQSLWRRIEDTAVAMALEDFAAFDSGRLELDLAEVDARDMSAMDASEQARVRSAVDEWIYQEQRALVEAMVRAYARRRLHPLLEQYEVLEVEREGEWQLAALNGDEIRFMSRPDALLRERATNELYIQSFKTGASWDVRKGKDAEHDAQGLSEGVEIERRLGAWWENWHEDGCPGPSTETGLRHQNWTDDIIRLLRSFSTPPRILGIRYEFLWKGDRRRDKDLTSRFGVDMRSQASHLVRGYHNPGMTDADAEWNWSWDYLKEGAAGGELSKLYWKVWRGTPVWEHMPIAKWIDMLDATVPTVGAEGQELGWSGPAQATGFTVAHPLDLVFHPPIIVYRGEDDLRDWVESTAAQEERIAGNVARVRAATDEGERRSLLNVLFPMTRSSCEYPSTCQFAGTKGRVGICYAGEHIKRAPLENGEYRVRVPNHPQESE
jgi:hypothetical protein